jgi:hypothetical protein
MHAELRAHPAGASPDVFHATEPRPNHRNQNVPVNPNKAKRTSRIVMITAQNRMTFATPI